MIAKTNPKVLANILIDEHPTIIAIILDNIDESIASEVLARLPESYKSIVTKTMQTLEDGNPESINNLLTAFKVM